jgi:hypothetical protein
MKIPGAKTDYGDSNALPDPRLAEELQLTTGGMLFVLGHRLYRVRWTTDYRAKEIDELVAQLLDPETLKKRLREKGLL